MALSYAGICLEQREVDLKNKPQDLLTVSPKGTVPVLILENGQVLQESLDIIKWALKQSDPQGWLSPELEPKGDALIFLFDKSFKPILDQYKYPQNSEKKDPAYYRDKATPYLEQLNRLLTQYSYLLSDDISFVDVALFPFIRQFYLVDTQWFEQSNYKFLQAWLDGFLNSELFHRVMIKSK